MNIEDQEAGKRALAAQVLRSWGSLRVRVSGTSMLPALWPGDILNIRSCNFEQTQCGELVLYSRDERFFVHRVVRKLHSSRERLLITRGDCMSQDDPAVPETNLLGRVIAIDRHDTILSPTNRPSLVHRISANALQRSEVFRNGVMRLRACGRWISSRQGFSAFNGQWV